MMIYNIMLQKKDQTEKPENMSQALIRQSP
jgi:hypothetical protein